MSNWATIDMNDGRMVAKLLNEDGYIVDRVVANAEELERFNDSDETIVLAEGDGL